MKQVQLCKSIDLPFTHQHQFHCAAVASNWRQALVTPIKIRVDQNLEFCLFFIKIDFHKREKEIKGIKNPRQNQPELFITYCIKYTFFFEIPSRYPQSPYITFCFSFPSRKRGRRKLQIMITNGKFCHLERVVVLLAPNV